MGLFRKKETKAPSSPSATSVREIQYDPKLVTSLEGDHQELKVLYSNIGELIRRRDYANLPAALISFKTRLQAHIMVENVRFYTYLEKNLGGNTDDASTMHDFRYEMNGIANRVIRFAKQYSASGVTELTHVQFEEEFKAIGTILEQRLHSEESSLYPLYMSLG